MFPSFKRNLSEGFVFSLRLFSISHAISILLNLEKVGFNFYSFLIESATFSRLISILLPKI